MIFDILKKRMSKNLLVRMNMKCQLDDINTRPFDWHELGFRVMQQISNGDWWGLSDIYC